jgi:hypothetical protein
MKRGLWFVAGTAAGVYATTKARRAAESFTVDGLHDRLTGWFAGARVLREEVEAGRREKETELRARLALGPDGEAPSNVRQLTGTPRKVED